MVNVPTPMLWLSVTTVVEASLFTVNELNVVAPVIDTAALFPRTTVDVPAENVPLFVQFPKRAIVAEPPAPVALALIRRSPVTLSVPAKFFAVAPPLVKVRLL